jgi:catechol 2,3-dioxygenase-like lactoylglutathione lyase family enzyme
MPTSLSKETEMLAVKRIAHITLTTRDLERQVDYYTSILGLTLVARDSGRAILATQTGLEAVVLERGSRPDAARLAMQVAPGSDLREISARLSKAGIASERRTDITPGVREAIDFQDPQGRGIEILADYAFPPPWNEHGGILPHKLGHSLPAWCARSSGSSLPPRRPTAAGSTGSLAVNQELSSLTPPRPSRAPDHAAALARAGRDRGRDWSYLVRCGSMRCGGSGAWCSDGCPR